MVSTYLFVATSATFVSASTVLSGADVAGAPVFDEFWEESTDAACHLQFMQLRAAREVPGKKALGKGQTIERLDGRAVGGGSDTQSDVAEVKRKDRDEEREDEKEGGNEHEVLDAREQKHEDVEENDGEESEAGGLAMSSHEHWPTWPCDEGESAWPKDIAWDFQVGTPIKMLLWTGWGFLTDRSTAGLPNCKFEKVPYTMGIPSDLNYDTSDYDVVIFHMSNLHFQYPEYYKLPQHKPEGQVWIAACGEPFKRTTTDIDCSLMNDTSVMNNFDYTSTFSLGSDFPAIQDPIIESVMRMDIPDFASRGPELATMVFSDCGGGREDWASKVMKSFEDRGRGDALLSYGRCLHNAEEPTCEEGDDLLASYKPWVNRCGSRPFKIVGENIQESWYVTEKIWDALAEGAIPVYWGASEVKRWMPEGSYLDVGDFQSTDALVDRMLAFTEADFAAAYAWKTQPASQWEGWMKAWRLSHYTLVPRLCEAAAKGKQSGGKWPTPDKE